MTFDLDVTPVETIPQEDHPNTQSSKIPRPLNPFMIYRKIMGPFVRQAFAMVSSREVSKILGEMWKNESEEIKAMCRTQSEEIKSLHHTLYPDYRYCPSKPKRKRDIQHESPKKELREETPANEAPLVIDDLEQPINDLDPPGYQAHYYKSPDQKKTKPQKSTQKDTKEADQLKFKKAWEIAIAPGKSLPMNAFMLWMSGNSVQIFSILITVMMFYNAIRGILSTSTAFEKFTYSGTVDPFKMCKLVHVAMQLLLVALAVWKCSAMGLLPTATSDWIAFLPQPKISEEWIVPLIRTFSPILVPVVKQLTNKQTQAQAAKSAIITSIIITLFSVALLVYTGVYHQVMPPKFKTYPIHVEYFESNITASTPFTMIKEGETFSLFLDLDAPESETNMQLGNFMVHSSLYNHNGHVFNATHRSGILKHKTSLFRYISTMYHILGLLWGWTLEAQTIRIPLYEHLIGCALNYSHLSLWINQPQLQLYRAHIVTEIEYQGLYYYMYKYWIKSALCFIFFFMIFEVIVICFVWKFLEFYIQQQEQQNIEDEPTLLSENSDYIKGILRESIKEE